MFDLLIDIENFEKIFIIPILVMREKEIEINENNNYYGFPNLNDPDLYSSKESDYIAIFNKLNKSNRKYSLSINYQDFDIKYFKKLGIRFDMIERLTFFEVNERKNKDIFKNMFLFNPNDLNNLIYLKISLVFSGISKYDDLYMSSSKIKLPQLEILDLGNPKEMQKLKDDEVCKNNSGIFGVKSSFLIEYHKIFDFTSLKNLKILVCGANDFIQLKDTLLEKVIIYNSYSSTTKLIEKLISIKTLKEISLVIDEIKENEINKINDINTSVIDLKLYIYKSCDILSIQNKFPNLQKLSVSNLFINICNTGYNIPRFEKKINISIEENSNSKINKLYLTIGDASFVSLYIPFENLTEIKLHGLINFNDFPIFQKNCNTIFKSLIYFECKIISDNRFNFLKYSEDFLNIFENINCWQI